MIKQMEIKFNSLSYIKEAVKSEKRKASGVRWTFLWLSINTPFSALTASCTRYTLN